jgi:GntR family transcriptional regulator, transcriptional repressor for pyruvate dehydrogenase complex
MTDVVGQPRAEPRRRLRQPRLANMVASELRDRILTGELADGAMLPKQEDLLAEFGVSLPSIREALRILETEGLVTVLRGNTGGAVVRAPQAGKVAYMIGLVLQSRGVAVGDVEDALRRFEPSCAALAAGRPDRVATVVPVLRARIAASEAVLENANEYVHQARRFHEELVAGCGNDTVILIVGALESLWSAHVDKLVRRPARLGEFDDLVVRERSLEDHVYLLEAIERGDPARAEELAQAHYGEARRHEFAAEGATVQATLLAED